MHAQGLHNSSPAKETNGGELEEDAGAESTDSGTTQAGRDTEEAKR